MSLYNITIIGRDNRILVAKKLLENDGASVIHITSRDQIDSVTQNGIITLPVPYKDASGNVKGTNISLADVASKLDKNSFVILGKADGDFLALSDQIGFKYCDLNMDLRFKKLNAIPTAEAALNIAMQYTPYTLYGHTALVCGYGCIAQCLAKLLLAFGAKVTVAARKHSDRIDAQYHGYNAIDICRISDNINDIDVVFNTCPAMVLPAEVIDRAKPSCVIIDLASRPGGCDLDYAKSKGLNAGIYLSLPDIYSPQTSGENLYRITTAVIDELTTKEG